MNQPIYTANVKNTNYGSKKRPMSAKNPMLQNKLNRNDVSTPKIIGEEIVNIQDNEVVNEQNEIEKENHPYQQNTTNISKNDMNFTEDLNIPKPAKKKQRPMSSYVGKKSDNQFSQNPSSKHIMTKRRYNMPEPSIKSFNKSNKHSVVNSIKTKDFYFKNHFENEDSLTIKDSFAT